MKVFLSSILICLLLIFVGTVKAYDPVQDPRLVRKSATASGTVKSSPRRKFYDMQDNERNRSARRSGDSELRDYSLTRGKRVE